MANFTLTDELYPNPDHVKLIDGSASEKHVTPGDVIDFWGAVDSTLDTTVEPLLVWTLGGVEVASTRNTIPADEIDQSYAATVTHQHLVDAGVPAGEHHVTTILPSAPEWERQTYTWDTPVQVNNPRDPSNISIFACGTLDSEQSVSAGESVEFTAQVTNKNSVGADVWVKWYAGDTEVAGVIQYVGPNTGAQFTAGTHPYDQLASMVGTGEHDLRAEIHEVRPPA